VGVCSKMSMPTPLDAAEIRELSTLVEAAWTDRARLEDEAHARAVRRTIAHLDAGRLRVVAPPVAPGDAFSVHAWVKQAIVLYFVLQPMRSERVGPYEYHDKIPLKRDYAEAGVRVVPPATVRYGAFLERGVIVMPSYVNIGAWVGEGTMVDTWATVGSCAQIGRHVHLSGGVGIGGVLEPPGAVPVIVEDGCFLGSRAIVVEGVHLEREVVLGANVVITASTPILDVTGPEPVTYKGRVPARSVVVPGTRTKSFPAGDYQLSAALIIGRRKESTDQRTSLNEALRTFGVAV
jgi:2,3,4,5-tetrahydropyridine-2,6-dicarboxylate N-succinyltransferase